MVDTPAIWAGTADYSGVVRDDVPDSDVAAYSICLEQSRKPSFVDIHCQVFTPTSFVDIFEKLVKLDLINFEIGAFFDTRVNTFEFHVSLRKLARDEERSGMRDRQYASIRAARRAIAASKLAGSPPATSSAPGAAVPDGAAADPSGLDLSAREMRALLLKRRVMHRLRHGVPLDR
ncbi:MAG TPA: hypothetical protein VHX40_01190 [Acidimicrobiales bacterium]|nr:hypothetical protein [Acidimicrobiales bacterium]